MEEAGTQQPGAGATGQTFREKRGTDTGLSQKVILVCKVTDLRRERMLTIKFASDFISDFL
jgi:hypothetical protein